MQKIDFIPKEVFKIFFKEKDKLHYSLFSTISESLLQDGHCSQAFADVFGFLSHKNLASIFFLWGLLHFSQPGSEMVTRLMTAMSPWGAELAPTVFSGRTPIQAKDFGMCPTSKLAFRVHFGSGDLKENHRPKPAQPPPSGWVARAHTRSLYLCCAPGATEAS